MKSAIRKFIILGLSIAIITTGTYHFSARSDVRPAIAPHFWLITSTEINASVGPLLDRYLADANAALRRHMPNIVTQKQAITLDLQQDTNQQARTLATFLENGFREQGLIGAFVVGLPLPEVQIQGQTTHSILPYGDFENKLFTFSQATNRFEQKGEETVEGKAEIILGYLPDLGTSGFTTYFDAHHNYSTGTLGYNRAVMYNDYINDTELRKSLKETLLSPVSGRQFDPSGFNNALISNDKSWAEALAGTKRWQTGISVTSNNVITTLDGWYNEPALETLRAILPVVATTFLELSASSEQSSLANQENTMGAFLNEIGAFREAIGIKNRFFSSENLSSVPNAVCLLENPLPATNSDEFLSFRNQFNALQTWISTVPRGSLLVKAPRANTVFVNGALRGEYFIVSPGDFVSTAGEEPLTVKTILVDPSVLERELTIPRTGFNHPGLVDTELPSWSNLEITNEQINELISWNYYLTKTEQYQYLMKNRLPTLNQFAVTPNTFEITFNIINQKMANTFTDNCLANRNPNTRSLITILSGYNAVDDDKLLIQELSAGKSLAVIATNSTKTSSNPSFDSMPNVRFSGLANPPLLTSFASGALLGKSIQSGSNEIINLFGDPCLTLP